MNWKRCANVLFIAFSLTALQASACGYFWDEEELYYKFFHDQEWFTEDLHGLLYTPMEPLFAGSMYDPNIRAWQERLGTDLPEEAISWAVYQMPLEEIMEVQRAAKGAFDITVSEATRTNPLVQRWFKKQHLDALAYLIYAKRCEPHCISRYYHWSEDEPENEQETKKDLIVQGKVLIESESDPWLKGRYAFQLVRLAHYDDNAEMADSFFEVYLARATEKSYIYYRALEQKAGALMDDDSPRHFARVYHELPDRRTECLRSFSFTGENSWQVSFDRCETNEERALMYMLRAFRYDGYEIEEMENIYALDPTSHLLALLMARQINMMERHAFPSQADQSLVYPEKIGSENLDRLLALCNKLLDNGRPEDQTLFLISKACMQLYQGEFNGARKTLKKVPADSPHTPQAQLLDFVSRIVELQKVDKATENAIYEEYASNAYFKECHDLMPLIKDRFGALYIQQEEFGKAFLCHHQPDMLEIFLDLNVIDAIIALQQKTTRTHFETYLLEGIELTDIYELRGSWYMQRNELENAIAEFKKLPTYHEIWTIYEGTEFMNRLIFAENIKHHFHTDIESQSAELYAPLPFTGEIENKLDLCTQMLALEQHAKKNRKEAAPIYFALGCAWNNLSPYGWFRNVMYHHEGNGYDSGYECNGTDWALPESFKFMSTKYYYDPQIAIGYFMKAMEATDDPELKARCVFFAAESRMYESPQNKEGCWHRTTGIEDEEPGRYELEYYDQLAEEYGNTAFYQEVLRECSYLREYINP